MKVLALIFVSAVMVLAFLVTYTVWEFFDC